MRISKKDYNEYALLWGVFTWLVSWSGSTATEVGEYVRTWGLNNPIAKEVAKRENVETYGYCE